MMPPHSVFAFSGCIQGDSVAVCSYRVADVEVSGVDEFFFCIDGLLCHQAQDSLAYFYQTCSPGTEGLVVEQLVKYGRVVLTHVVAECLEVLESAEVEVDHEGQQLDKRHAGRKSPRTVKSVKNPALLLVKLLDKGMYSAR